MTEMGIPRVVHRPPHHRCNVVEQIESTETHICARLSHLGDLLGVCEKRREEECAEIKEVAQAVDDGGKRIESLMEDSFRKTMRESKLTQLTVIGLMTAVLIGIALFWSTAFLFGR